MHVLTPISLISSIFCRGGDEKFITAVSAAAAGVEVRRMAETDRAVPTPSGGGVGVLALCDTDSEQVERFRSQLDDAGLPQWPIALFSSREEPVPNAPAVIPRSQWQPALMARALLAAVVEHQLRRENAQLRGDLLTFGTRVAHDLRTPLGGILTTTEMLREVLAEDAPGHVALTQPVVESAEGLAALIERTSQFAKAVASSGPFERFDMGVAFWNAFQQLESRIIKAGAALTQPPNWPRVEGRQAWLEIVWRNLLTNALQHAGPGVRLEAGWAPDDDGNRFWLWDSGTVPEARRAGLFAPFNQLHHPGAPRGLGLPIVRRLVELQGGHCGFEVPAHGGSRFFFVLPPAAAVIAPDAPANPLP